MTPFQAMRLKGGGGGGGPTDPLFANVVSLVPFNDLSGSTTPDDIIPARSWTAYGSAFVTTSEYRYGTGAFNTNNGSSTAAGMYDADHTDWDFPADFTLEMWIEFINLSGISGGASMLARKGPGISPYVIYETGGQIQGLASNNGSSWAVAPIGGTVTVGPDYFIEFGRSGNNFYLFLDGTQIGGTATMSGALTTNSGVMVLGGEDGGGGSGAQAYIKGWRATKGICRNTSNYTPPVAAFPTS